MKKTPFNSKTLVLLLLLCLTCMIIGSFYDYQISLKLYNPNSWFGIVLAAYGQLPVSLGTIICAVLYYVSMDKKRSFKLALKSIGIVLLIIIGYLQMSIEAMLYIPDMNRTLSVIINITIIAITIPLVKRFAKKQDRSAIKRLAKFLTFVILAQFLIIAIIKPIAARPRMRMLEATPSAKFQNWWEFDNSQKNIYMASYNIPSEEFKSFPSGHTGCATVILAYAVLPLIKGHLKTSWIVFGLGIIYAVLVALSRIILGAHFLSDVTMGFFIAFICCFIAYKIFYVNNP